MHDGEKLECWQGPY